MGIQYILEIVGTFAFAISGTLTVEDRGCGDWFAACFTACLSSIGGGTRRDVLLGSCPLVWVAHINFLYASLVGIIIAFLFYKYLIEFKRTLFLFDTFG